jgi:peptidoglycan/LPS O-acetylase OafA/YrhL
MDEAGRPRLHVIDGLRIFAACLVMFFHLGYWSWANPRSRGAMILEGTAQFPQLAAYSWWGWVGVEIFFVISGFVISYSSANASFPRFVRSRFLRLFPAILVCASITFAVIVATDLMPFSRALQAYWRTLVIWPFGGWLDNVYWTLSTELTFYAVVAAFLLLGRPQLLAVAMGAIGVVTSALAAASYFGGDGGPLVPGLGEQLSETLLWRHGMYFSLGYFIWSATATGWTRTKSLLIAFLLLGGAFPILTGAGSLSRAPGVGPAWVPLVVWLAAMAIMIASVAVASPKDAQPARRWLTLLGMSTYPLYLLHYIAGATLMAMLVRAGWSPGMALAASCLAMIASAIAVTVLVEAGPRRWFAAAIDATFGAKRAAGSRMTIAQED